VAAYNLILLVGFAVIAIFAFLLAGGREQPGIGLFAAVACTGSGTVLSISEFPSNFLSFAMLFPLLWICRTAATRPQRLLAIPPLLYCSLTAGGLVYVAVTVLLVTGLLLAALRRRQLAASRAALVALITLLLCWPPLFYFGFGEFYRHSALATGATAGTLDFRLEFAELVKAFVPWDNTWSGFSPASNYPFVYCGMTVAILFVLGIRRRPGLAAGAVLLALVAAFGSREFPLHLFRYPEKLFIYAVLLMIAVATAALARRRGRPGALMLAGGALMLELLLVNRPYFLTLPLTELLAAGAATPLPAGARVMSLVSADLMPQFNAASLPAYHREQFRFHYGLTAAWFGQSTFLGYSPARLASYQRLRDLHARTDVTADQLTNLLRHCGVTRITARRTINGRAVIAAPGWQQTCARPADDLQIFALAPALPLLLTDTTFAACRPAAAALAPPAGQPLPASAPGDHCALTVTGPGVLVLDKLDYPGWRTSIDGRRCAADRAFDAFLAVPVPAGRHTVSARFVPTGLWLNLLPQLLAVALLAGIWRRFGD